MASVFKKCANNYAMFNDLSQRLSYCLQNGFIWLTEQLFPWKGNYFMPHLWSTGNGQVAKCLFNILDMVMQLHMCMFGEAVFH